ncbi:MAG: hypothetical protein WB902_05405 [Acetobacteraceae bacterium]|jgi:hypothetical protein
MSVIDAVIEQHRVTRVFFDCRPGAPDPRDERRIEQAIELSIAEGQADDAAPTQLPFAA